MHLRVPSKIVIEDSKVRESWIFTLENIEEKNRKFVDFVRENIIGENFSRRLFFHDIVTYVFI